MSSGLFLITETDHNAFIPPSDPFQSLLRLYSSNDEPIFLNEKGSIDAETLQLIRTMQLSRANLRTESCWADPDVCK